MRQRPVLERFKTQRAGPKACALREVLKPFLELEHEPVGHDLGTRVPRDQRTQRPIDR